jgi:hypothetical protein
MSTMITPLYAGNPEYPEVRESVKIQGCGQSAGNDAKAVRSLRD